MHGTGVRPGSALPPTPLEIRAPLGCTTLMLVDCVVCGKSLSQDAKKCVNCGLAAPFDLVAHQGWEQLARWILQHSDRLMEELHAARRSNVECEVCASPRSLTGPCSSCGTERRAATCGHPTCANSATGYGLVPGPGLSPACSSHCLYDGHVDNECEDCGLCGAQRFIRKAYRSGKADYTRTIHQYAQFDDSMSALCLHVRRLPEHAEWLKRRQEKRVREKQLAAQKRSEERARAQHEEQVQQAQKAKQARQLAENAKARRSQEFRVVVVGIVVMILAATGFALFASP
jgi:hypothetical protein